MTKSICFFNHKGGVSKTTTTFNLGWALADEGKKVLMVDLDSQCNLTGMVLGYEKIDEGLDSFYSSRDNLTLGPIVEYLINGGQPEAYLEKETGKLHPTLHEKPSASSRTFRCFGLRFTDKCFSKKLLLVFLLQENIPGNLPKNITANRHEE